MRAASPSWGDVRALLEGGNNVGRRDIRAEGSKMSVDIVVRGQFEAWINTHPSINKAGKSKQSQIQSLALDSMARRDRSFSPEASNKRVRPSHRSPRSPSPTRRNVQRTSNRSRYEEDRERERDRPRERFREDRHRDDRRRDNYRDDRRDDRRRSRSRERRPPTPPRAQLEPVQTPPPEDDKLKAKRAKLEAWKKEREAKKALDEAKAKAMALAGKSVPGE